MSPGLRPPERSTMESLIFPLLIALLAVPLFLQARKQKKAMQEQQKLQNSLATGDRVMTTSGLFGTIVGTADDTLEVEIAPGLVTTWVRAAVREKVNVDAAEAESTEDTEATEDAEVSTDAPSVKSDDSHAEVAKPIEQQKN